MYSFGLIIPEYIATKNYYDGSNLVVKKGEILQNVKFTPSLSEYYANEFSEVQLPKVSTHIIRSNGKVEIWRTDYTKIVFLLAVFVFIFSFGRIYQKRILK
jgi:hypothetical protein